MRERTVSLMKKQAKHITAVISVLAALFILSVSAFAGLPPLQVSQTKVGMYAGDKYTVSATYSGKKIKPKWTTNNKAVATVSASGVITGVKAGYADITASYNNRKEVISVFVFAPKQSISVTGKTVKVSGGAMTMVVNAKDSLITTLKTKRAKTTSSVLNPGLVKWASSNESVAAVSANGVITAKKVGKAVITATYKKLSFKFMVTVNKTCSHVWEEVYKTVHHDAVTHKEIIPGKTEKIWHDGKIIGYVQECGCGQQFNSMEELNQHQFQASLNGEDGHASHWEVPITSEGYYETITTPDKTITVVDKEAYDEKVLTGYKCRKCGKTRAK